MGTTSDLGLQFHPYPSLFNGLQLYLVRRLLQSLLEVNTDPEVSNSVLLSGNNKIAKLKWNSCGTEFSLLLPQVITSYTSLSKRWMFLFEIEVCPLKLGNYITENVAFMTGFCLLNVKLGLWRISHPRDITTTSESGGPMFLASAGSFLAPLLGSFHRLALLDILGISYNWKLTWTQKKPKPINQRKRMLSGLMGSAPPCSNMNSRARTWTQLERRARRVPEYLF